VNLDVCRARGIPVLRRASGGATIVTGHGCLMYAVVLAYRGRSHLRDISQAHRFVLDTIAAGLQAAGGRPQAVSSGRPAAGDLRPAVVRRAGARMGHAFTGMPWLGTAMLVVTAVMLSSASALAAAFAFRPRTEERVAEQLQYSAAARAIVRYSRPGEPVLILATSTATPYPLLTQLSRQPAARYLEDFPIPMFYYGATGTPGQVFPYRTGSGTVPEDERLFLDELRADIERARPKLILVDDRRTCDWCPEGFGLHEYLVKNHFIADALVRYRGAGKAGDFVVYLPDGIPAS
jgi:hypothetical protein